MKTRQEMLNVLGLKRAEQKACFEFAVHLSCCEICNTWHGPCGSTTSLCDAGLEARDKRILAARGYADVDQDFARKNEELLRGVIT